MMFKNNIKKYISSLAAAATVIGAFSVGFVSYGADSVAINAANFPDANLRDVVSEWYDTDGDGVLQQSEIQGIKTISIPGMLEDTCGEDAEISDLTGIENFTDCVRLRCGGIGLKTIDVSKMPQLVELTCGGNNLSSIDVSQNTNLEWLNCPSNALSALDISANTKLTRLDCYINKLTSIDLSANTALTALYCQQNDLASLNVSALTVLKTLNCSVNHLKALDLSANTALEKASNSLIGNQTVDAPARYENPAIFVQLAIDNPSNITSTSLDRVDIVDGVEVSVPGYDGIDFTPQNADELINGIEYYYNTGLSFAEDMKVTVNPIRNFYQVKFFKDETKTDVVGSVIVNKGETATAPEITDAPQCKAFVEWSTDLTNITTDIETYAVWKDDHSLAVTSFNDNIVHIECTKCGKQQIDASFTAILNAEKGDENYVALADVNNDGIINGKDYARLLNTFRN